MSNPLNYLRPKDQDTIEWNKKLNREDIIHDSPGLNGKTGDKYNNLFQICLNRFFPNDGQAEYVEAPLRVVLPGKEFKKKPEQLKNINESIPDTYPGKKLGLPDRISPSFYFDPASRKFAGQFPKLKEFLTSKGAENINIHLQQYGINDFSYKVVTHPNCMVFEFYFNNIIQFTVTIDKDGYVITSPTNTATPDPSYVSGNEAKKAFFVANKNSGTSKDFMDGLRLIFCKLLGDLSHVIYSDDNTAVFTNDTYLRDRCIKNKCPAVYREPAPKETVKTKLPLNKNKKSLLKKGGVKSIKPSKKIVKIGDKLVKPKNSLSTYVLHDIDRRATRGGGETIEAPSDSNFANECNKANLLREIDEIVGRLETFLNDEKRSFTINGQDFKCTEIIDKKLRSIVDFLKGGAKEEINKIDTSLSIDEYNSSIMRWFPLQILFCPEDMNTSMYTYAGNTYYSPLDVDRLFPELEDKIGDFDNVFDDGSFKKFVMNGTTDESKNKSGDLNKILSFLTEEFKQLSKSDELDEANKLLTNAPKQIDSDDFAELVDYAIDFGILTEHDITIEYLKNICGDDLEAQTYYSRLLPLVYFDGYHVYDYDLLSAFVQSFKTKNAPRGNEGFIAFLAENMKDDEEIVDEIEPETNQLPDFRKLGTEPGKAFETVFGQSIPTNGGSRKTLKKRRTKRANKKSKKNTKRRSRKH